MGGGPGAGPREYRGRDQRDTGGIRVNERIRGVSQVRVIDETGKMIGILPVVEAVKAAKDRGLDLLEVSPTADPPVCKIADYGKFMYEKKKKEQEAKKKQTVMKLKEIQLRPQTDEHDLDYKFKNVLGFLEDGDKAKISVLFRGREIAYVENGRKLLDRLIEMVKDKGTVESPPKLEGKRLSVVISPISKKS
jgi:translation initiation factor IF-3